MSGAPRNGGSDMRFIQGIIVGALLMVGSAYLHDTGMVGIGVAEGKPPPAFVNWDTLWGTIGR
jgi:hypothetical protein